VGTGIELVLLAHYEDAWQVVPLVLLALATVVILWHALKPAAATLRVLQATMALLFVAGVTGVALHFNGAAEFAREIDPSLATWPLIGKVMTAKAPPLLAPGAMMQLGLLGLAYGFSDRERRSNG
jgi:hypothetical protein